MHDDATVDEGVLGRPHPALRAAVAGYVGYRQRGLPPSLHRGLPSPFLTLIFTLDEPLHIAAHVDPRQSPGQYRTLVGGLHTTPALIAQHGAQSGVQLAVSPLAARALLGLPAGEIAATDLHGHELLGAAAGDLQERLRDAPSWARRFALLDAHLAPRMRAERVPEVAAEVRHAWRRLTVTRGAISVGELARETGWSTRHLTRRMRVETGLTPKQAARVIRFDRARRALQAGAGEAGMAAVAAHHGYADQSHLVREFRALAGTSPGRWLAEEQHTQVANVQDSTLELGQAGGHDDTTAPGLAYASRA